MILVFSIFGYAQVDTTPLTFTEQMPEFPGGYDALLNYLMKNIRYPAKALEYGIQGTCNIDFVVEIDGSISDVKVFNPMERTLGEESIRVVKLMPRWKPGYQKGVPVRVSYTVPITYTLDDGNNKVVTKKMTKEELLKMTMKEGTTFSLVYNQNLIFGGNYTKGAFNGLLYTIFEQAVPGDVFYFSNVMNKIQLENIYVKVI